MMESQKVCHKNMGDGIADDGESMPALIKKKSWKDMINKRKNDDIHEKQ